MTRLQNSITKSAKGRTPLALLGILLALGAAAAVAAGGKADFSLAGSPASQTVSQGGTATYTMTVTRVNGFSGAVTLSAGQLPAGVTVQFSPSNTISSSSSTGSVKVKTSATTAAGTYTIPVAGTSGSLSHTANVTLVVQSATVPAFSITSSPASQTIAQGASTSFSTTVTRTGGFSGAVSLAVSGLPSGATATWNPSSTVASSGSGATLSVDTQPTVATGSYALTITGTGSTGTQSSSVTLVVAQGQSLQITGNATDKLAPGVTTPLNLVIANPYSQAISVTGISVSLQEGTSRAGCSGSQNFTVKQMGAVYPLTVPAGASMTLSQLGVADRDKPKLAMTDQPWNQDACKNAVVQLSYSGSATK
jgi:uncharacterized membrane protein